MARNVFFIIKSSPGFQVDQQHITDEPRHEKTCLEKTCLQESATRYDSNRPAQLQKLARVFKFWI